MKPHLSIDALHSLFGHHSAAEAQRGASTLPDWPGLVPGMLLCGQYLLGMPLRATEHAALFAAQPVSGVHRSPVAVRVVKLQGALRGSAVTASLAALNDALAQPGVQRLRAATSLGGYLFLLCDWPRGSCLRDLLAVRGRGFEPDESAHIVRGIAAALDALHTARPSIVHRLLSTDAVHYDTDAGAVLLSDVALAAGVSHEEVLGRMQDAEPSYLAPEEIESPRVTLTPARDVFVLASIAFELITGQRAFPGITRQEVTRQILSPVRPRPAVQGRALPGALDVVLMRAWSLWPNARFSSAGEFANEFSRVLGSVPRTSSGTRPAVNLSALDPRRRVDTPPSSFTRAAPVSRPVSLEAPPAPTQLRFDPPSPGTMRIPIPPRTATPSQRPVATALPFKVPAPSAPVVAPLAPKLAPSGPIAARVPTLQPRPAAPPPPPPSALGVRTTPKASPPPPPPASRVKK